MDITCVSDLHGHYPKLEGGELLIVAGDLTARDTVDEYRVFFSWFTAQDYRKKILIAGNHDNSLQGTWPGNTKGPFREDKTFYDFDYLCDSGTEFEGLKIWGSPWTKTFPGMNPNCMAFTVGTDEELADKFSTIPHDVDILITHCPPHGILDTVFDVDKRMYRNVGALYLRGALEYAFRPKLWVFGHIHNSYGTEIFRDSTKLVNAAHVNEYYEPVNKPVRIDL